MTKLIILAGIVAAGAIVLKFLSELSSATSKPQYRYARKESLLTPAETKCYKALVEAFGAEYFIFAQVHLSSLLDEKQFKGQNWKGARSRVDRKSVDFVLCDKERLSPVLAIELDDWTHGRRDRQERDVLVEEFFAGAGLPLLRITDTDDLAVKIQQKLHPQPAA